MGATRRVFASLPSEERLDSRRQAIRAAILEKIRSRGYQPEVFLESGTAAAMSWSFRNVDEVMRRCVGAVILAFPRWAFMTEEGELRFTSEYSHYEGAIANAFRVPLLIIAERGLAERGVIWTGAGHPILFLPEDADPSWVETEAFTHRFSLWAEDLEERRDVFLGYCSKARDAAQSIHLFLSEKLQLRVLNWAMDFAGGGTILEEIERAARLCSCGIFLFTNDDPLEGAAGQAAPRDNVVFEAGYFASARGRDRVLIIREEGAKMPADVGGSIYLNLEDKHNTKSI
jgi:hypothetical protein